VMAIATLTSGVFPDTLSSENWQQVFRRLIAVVRA